jgi:hypothetical protein
MVYLMTLPVLQAVKCGIVGDKKIMLGDLDGSSRELISVFS